MVRHAETADDELETRYIYVLSDGTGAVRYAGSTGNLRRRETLHRHSHRRCALRGMPRPHSALRLRACPGAPCIARAARHARPEASRPP